jgi:hypothetical protein
MIRLIVLAVIAVASLTYALVERWEVIEHNSIIAGLRRQIAESAQSATDAKAALAKVQQQLDESNANVARLTRERDDAIARLKTTSSGDVAAAGAPGAPADAGKGKPQGYAAFAKMFESEEGRKMMKSQGAMMTRMMYSDLARVLKLSPQDAEQVMAMLNDRQSAMSEGQFKFMGEGKFDEATAKQMGEQSAEVKKDYDAKLKGLLGEQKFQEMQDYERTLGDRMALTQYETQFSAAGVPLKTEQRDALLGIMARERKNSPPPILDNTGQDPAKSFAAMRDDASVEKYFAQEEEYQRRVMAAATKGPNPLSPDQVNALQQGFKQFGEMQKFGMKMMQQMIKEGGAPGAPAAPPAPVVETPR